MRPLHKFLPSFLALFGIFPVDPRAAPSSLTFRYRSILVMINLLHITLPMVLLWEDLSNRAVQSRKLSRKILHLTYLPANFLVNGIVHFGALCSCGQTVLMLQKFTDLSTDARRVGGVMLEQTSKIDRVCRIMVEVFVFVQLVRCGDKIVEIIREPEVLLAVPMPLPENLLLRVTCTGFMLMAVFLGVAYAAAFIVFGGVHLLCVHRVFYHSLTLCLTNNACRHGAVSSARVASASGSSSPTNLSSDEECSLEQVQATFIELKKGFKMYQDISGWYTLALILLGTLQLVKACGYIAIMESGESQAENIGLLFQALMMICLLSCFGEYFKRSIGNSQTKLLEQYGGPGAQSLIAWYVAWTPQLTAKNFFSLEQMLIMKVLATVTTYFIFVLQLNVSEQTQMVYNSTSCIINHTVVLPT